MTLTKKEKQAVLKAMESICAERAGFSCLALKYACLQDGVSLDLVYRYSDFFGGPPCSEWDEVLDPYTAQGRLQRLNMLALFLAAEGEIG